MFNKKLKLEVKELERLVESQQLIIKRLVADNSKFKVNFEEYLEWKKMRDANEEAAATMGHFYITADDTALLEKLIQEVNKDPDLAVLLTTAQGTTLTLRSHPRPQVKDNFIDYRKYAEEEK